MIQVIGAWASYLTEKTETTEVVIASKHAIISLKVVVSANGRKTAVYSGIDQAMVYEDTLNHRYFQNLWRSLEKYSGGQPAFMSEPTVEACFLKLPVDIQDAIGRELIADEKVNAHWEMLLGNIPVQSSASGTRRTTTTVASPKKGKPKIDRHSELLRVDDGYGIF